MCYANSALIALSDLLLHWHASHSALLGVIHKIRTRSASQVMDIKRQPEWRTLSQGWTLRNAAEFVTHLLQINPSLVEVSCWRTDRDALRYDEGRHVIALGIMQRERVFWLTRRPV